MTEDQKKEFEEFLEWKKEKETLTETKMSENSNSNGFNNNVQHNKSSNSGWKSGCGLGCLGIIVLFFILALSSKSGKDDVVDWSEASVMSESFIKSFMKFPDDVTFIKESRNVNEEGNGVFKITGRLKANNTFGQAVPYTYNIRIQYKGGDWTSKGNWSFLGGNLYNEATQEFTEIE
jgi:hypothetical protein